ncbi:CHAT domain-containing protein [Lactifluus subvellereus]|nr:CHAT domain-containing protein [Lactifluus subvellereus]
MALNANYGAQGSSISPISMYPLDSNDVNSQLNQWQTEASTLPFRHPDRAWFAHNIATCYMSRYEATRQEVDLDQAIVGYVEALLRGWDHPPMDILTFEHLTRALLTRFDNFGAKEDLDHIISYFRYLSNLPLNVPGINRLDVLNGLANAFISRFEVGGRPEDIEDAISLLRHIITTVLQGTDDYRLIASKLAYAWVKKYEQTGESEDLTEAISHYRATPWDVLALRSQRSDDLDDSDVNDASTLLQESLDLLDKEDPTEYLEKAISKFREVLLLCPPDHESKVTLLINLALSLMDRFKSFGRMDCLEEAISLYRAALRLCPGSPTSTTFFEWIRRRHVFALLRTRRVEDLEESINLGQHLEESIALYRSAVEHPFSSPRDRLIAANNWTFTAHNTRHSSALTAYRKALSLLQRAIDLGPTVQTRHEYISDRHIGPLRNLPMNAASYAIKSWAYEDAVEMLEQGERSCADEFTEISQALEEIITTTDVHDFVQTPAGTDDDGVASRLADPSITGIRELLETHPFSSPPNAAIGGPVVIINLSEFRSDILIVRYNHPVVHIPTPTNFFDRVIKLAHQLSETRKSHRLESKTYGRVLRQTLEELSELVGQPVASRLMELGIPEQSRIWLCPTSVLASLPIHAAGPISSHTNVKRYLCDIYICSYTPSLSTLIASRSGNLSGSASGPPSLLIVGQPDESLPGVDSETRSIECLVGSNSVTRIAGEAATPENVITHLPMHPWVHFACHGMLQPGRPFESSFRLQHNTHLTLLRIAKSHLPTAELAFLAACHTAELTEDGAPDEVLHLTAAMQFSGFRSVIGTMWAMVDEDGQGLSEHFYSKMFTAGAQVASYETSAMALRHATQKLRAEKGVSLERWVNFVHYGLD